MTSHKLLINTRTQTQLDNFCVRPTHALLITGEIGSGLSTIADYVAQKLSGIHPGLVVTRIQGEEMSGITIDAVRELRAGLKHKQNSQYITRIVMLYDVELMQHEAQNALLKILEEPPEGVLLILMSHNSTRVLQTIQSRAVCISVLPIPMQDAQKYFTSVSSKDLEQAYLLSEGRAGSLIALLNGGDSQDGKDIMRQAKEVLGSTLSQRLQMIETHFKRKEMAQQVVVSLQQLSRAAMLQHPHKTNWQRNLEATLHAQSMLRANVQTKLVLCRLFTHLQ